jgi:hypothetical protein
MIDLELIRSSVIDGLAGHMDMPVINTDDGEKPSAYPYITYSFNGTLVFPGSTPSVTIVPSSSIEVIERFMEQPTFTMSFNSCSSQKSESLANLLRLHDWFRVIGYDALKRDADVVFVKAGEILNRDIQINNVWERISGVDITFRTTSLIEVKQPTIDTVNWN